MTTNDTKPPKIHVGKMGGVQVDAKEFLNRPGVKERIEEVKKLDIAGKTLVGNRLISSDKKSQAA